MIQIKYFENGNIYTKIEFDEKYNLNGLYEQYYYFDNILVKSANQIRIKAIFHKNLLQECITYYPNGNIHKDYIHKKYYKEYDINNNLIINYYFDESQNKFYNPNKLNQEFGEFDDEEEDVKKDTLNYELRKKQSINITEEVKYIRDRVERGYIIVINNQ